ncbi:MAG TPA: hypothetical protein VJ836_01915 [Candidatus Saccharimonadales bacterium]|nr:hypothetical protein [Candidatus Saccharimonadales bacterium]
MTQSIHRSKATDSVELQGRLNNEASETPALYVHGMSGNGYENYFLDNLREMYAQQDISFLLLIRGRAVLLAHFGKAAKVASLAAVISRFFEEKLPTISKSVMQYLKSLDKRVITDMVGWANTDPQHEQYLAKAKQLLAEGKSEELVGAQC